jgi:hypothetical protein
MVQYDKTEVGFVLISAPDNPIIDILANFEKKHFWDPHPFGLPYSILKLAEPSAASGANISGL